MDDVRLTLQHKNIRVILKLVIQKMRYLGALFVTMFICISAQAKQYDVYPHNADDDCNEPFEQIANAMTAGDILVVHDGIYSQSCTRSIELRGTPENPIVIRAADGARPTLTRPNRNRDTQNNLEIVDSAHLVIRGLRFFGGSIGVRFIRGHDIVFEDNEVTATDSSAVTINSGDAQRLTLRNNHIHHAGQGRGGPTTGEGIYVGCNDSACSVSDSLFESNYIHDLRATHDGGNDGIEIKPGSGGNIIRGNRIHDTTHGRAFPCIFVYGDTPKPNIVTDNLLFGCGEALQVVADAIVTNNQILDSSIAGIVSSPHAQVGPPRNLDIRDNVVSGHPMCVQIDWRQAQNVRFEGNALHCAGTTAVRAQGLANATVGNNSYAGRSNVVHEGLVETGAGP